MPLGLFQPTPTPQSNRDRTAAPGRFCFSAWSSHLTLLIGLPSLCLLGWITGKNLSASECGKCHFWIFSICTKRTHHTRNWEKGVKYSWGQIQLVSSIYHKIIKKEREGGKKEKLFSSIILIVVLLRLGS